MPRAPRHICAALLILLPTLLLRADTLGLNTPSLVTDLSNKNLDPQGHLGPTTPAAPTTRPTPSPAYQLPALLTPTLPFPLVSLPPTTQPSCR